MIEIKSRGVPIKAWVEGVQVEEEAEKQLQNVASLPIVWPHIAVAPDVHWGVGATVGSIIPTLGAIIPAAVGVDIGCGVIACKLSINASQLPESLAVLRSAIEAAVPHGRTANGGKGDRGAWGDVPERTSSNWGWLAEDYAKITDKHPKAKAFNDVAHLGTLGGGNHFIEVCLDTEQQVWVMLHSGSRGVGNRIGSYFIELAKQDMIAAHGYIPEDQNLSYFMEGAQHFNDYVEAVGWAQQYARMNRAIMMENTLDAVREIIDPDHTLDMQIVGEAINCHHNYVQKETHFGKEVWLTRKGACNAEKDRLAVIPGSMGAKSFIVRGKGNPESFNSCSHGAGRAMSRTAAKKMFSLDDHAKAMIGVEARLDADIVDETPGAYKSIDAVMAAQADLVEVVATLKQVLCVKG